jgi:protein TonB
LAALLLIRSPQPLLSNGETPAIVVDLAPLFPPRPDWEPDVAPGPLQQEAQSSPETPPQPEESPLEKADRPDPANTEVVLPREPDKIVDPREESALPAPQTTAPAPPRASAAQVALWHRKIATQLEKHKRYPPAARHRTGLAQLSFSLNRQGLVLTSRIIRSSGSAALDQEAMATVRRAQPFPPPPSNMPGERFDFTVPIRFNAR